jgi:hypothetical protein
VASSTSTTGLPDHRSLRAILTTPLRHCSRALRSRAANRLYCSRPASHSLTRNHPPTRTQQRNGAASRFWTLQVRSAGRWPSLRLDKHDRAAVVEVERYFEEEERFVENSPGFSLRPRARMRGPRWSMIGDLDDRPGASVRV